MVGTDRCKQSHLAEETAIPKELRKQKWWESSLLTLSDLLAGPAVQRNHNRLLK